MQTLCKLEISNLQYIKFPEHLPEMVEILDSTWLEIQVHMVHRLGYYRRAAELQMVMHLDETNLYDQF